MIKNKCAETSVVDVLIYYRLAEKMQSLFTIFASHIVVHAAQVLKDNNKQITGNIPIWFPQLFTALNKKYAISFGSDMLIIWWTFDGWTKFYCL